MKFIYPEFLLALLAVSIPIIIHLFNFKRYKKVLFPNVRFLKEVIEETTNRNRLKHLLILASRILAVTFLVLAFAQPFIPASDNQKEVSSSAISIFVDNSFSMSSSGENGVLLEEGKQFAYEIKNSFKEGDRFQYVLNAGSTQSPRFMHKASIDESIGLTEMTYGSEKLKSVLNRMTQSIKDRPEEGKEVFLVSDFQQSNFNLNNDDFDSSINYHFIPLKSNVSDNLYIDSIWFENPVRKLGIPDQVFYRVRNAGEVSREGLPINLTINGKQKSSDNIDVVANGSKIGSFDYTIFQPGIQKGSISIEDYPIVFDNTMFFSYSLKEKISVLAINSGDSSKVIQALFGSDKNFELTQTSISQLVPEKVNISDIIILNNLNSLSTGFSNEIIEATSSGKKVIIFPGEQADILNYSSFFRAFDANLMIESDSQNLRIASVNYESIIYKNAFDKPSESQDLPNVFRYYKFNSDGSINKESLLGLSNGKDFLVKYPFGKGELFVWAVPTSDNWSNLTKHALFVVSMYQIATLNSFSQSLYSTIGDEFHYSLPLSIETDRNIIIKGESNEFIPEIRKKGNLVELWFYDNLRTAGQFDILKNNETVDCLSANYSRLESKLAPLSSEDIITQLGGEIPKNIYFHDTDFQNVGKSIQNIQEGKRLWDIMLLAALLMLLFEILLIKFWKE